MIKTEIASLMNEQGKVFEWAQKVERKMEMNSEDKDISSVIDAWAKDIGTKGIDNDLEISNFLVKVVNPEVYDVPDELLESLFDRGSIGEFDDFKTTENPKNTLVAYDAAKGGTVDKSYIDNIASNPIWKHKQVETEVSYADLRRNGFKSIANLTVFAEEALKNKMFFDIFSIIDTAIAGGEQLINAGGAMPTAAALDQLALYLIDRGENPMTVSLSKYAQSIAKMSGQASLMSDAMKDKYNRYGLVDFYNGVRIGTISGAKRTGDNQLLLPDKRIFGVAGKIGTLDMRGAVRVYETMDNKREVVELKITGFEYGVAINKIDKIAKIVLT
ncbi:hypothetical protein [Paenibacillus pini]|uniref:Phage major capsid protein n=1 Tax=Paenibacillus pini JCM 16418 TaxID=1236976 RepID=W7YUE1_9BACL|nr:hypothetical protein [Paenibacillus pini]GAF10843.1 hypothetical protein JCM16418_5068 [Paenibacillus pini JCM 16418]